MYIHLEAFYFTLRATDTITFEFLSSGVEHIDIALAQLRLSFLRRTSHASARKPTCRRPPTYVSPLQPAVLRSCAIFVPYRPNPGNLSQIVQTANTPPGSTNCRSYRSRIYLSISLSVYIALNIYMDHEVAIDTYLRCMNVEHRKSVFTQPRVFVFLVQACTVRGRIKYVQAVAFSLSPCFPFRSRGPCRSCPAPGHW